MVVFHPRETLGLGQPIERRLSLRKFSGPWNGLAGITDHWTGAGGKLFHPDPIQRLRGIYRFHVVNLGYGDIAYEGAYDADGNVYGLRDSKYVGAHAASVNNYANISTNGICFLEDERGLTTAAVAAWHYCRELYALATGRQPHTWTHHHWGDAGAPGKPTECPGPALRALDTYTGGTD